MKTLRFRLQIASVFALAIFLFSGSSALAAPSRSSGASSRTSLRHPKLPSFSRVLSYNELMRLPHAKRVKYLRGLRLMLAEVERLPSKLRASQDIETSQIAALLAAFGGDEAFAGGGVPTPSGNSLTCGDPSLKVNFPTADRPGVNRTHGTDSTTVVCTKLQSQTTECGSGFVAVRQESDRSFWCATSASFGNLPNMLQRNARHAVTDCRGVYPETCTFIKSGPALAALRAGQNANHLQIIVDGAPGTGTTAPAGAPPAADSRNAEAAARAAANARAGTARPPAAAPRVAAPATGVAGGRERSGTETGAPAGAPSAEAASGTNRESSVVGTPVRPNRAGSGGTTGDANGDSNGDANGGADGDANGDQPEVANQCNADSDAPKQCDAAEIESARREYAGQRDKLDCIYAGGVSEYNGGVKRAYNCAAPHSFCYSTRNCVDGQNNHHQPDYACEGSQVICNPLVFGLQSDGTTPLCVDKGANATQSCESAVPEDGKMLFDVPHNGMKEAWNDFADGLHELCHANPTAAKLHCAECDIIQRRLWQLNVAARDIRSCGEAIKYEDSQCDSNGKCTGLPGRGTRPAARVARDDSGDTDAGDGGSGSGDSGSGGSGQPEVVERGRGQRGIQSVNDWTEFSDPRSVFNTPVSRPAN